MDSNKKIWFIHINNSPDGPHSTEEIWDKLNKNKITYSNFIWQKGYKNWIKIEEESTFDQAPPEDPTHDDAPPTLLVADPNSKVEPSIWYINEKKSRSGPFKESEVIDKISKKTISSNSFVWKKGMKEWILTIKSTEFKEYFKTDGKKSKPKAKDFMDVKSAKPKKEPLKAEESENFASNKRKSPRAPLLARVIAHDNQDIAYMPCGNISTGGTFVYTEKFLWEPGTNLKLNIKSDELPEAFNVEGKVLSFAEKPNKGYSIKFVNLSDKYKTMLDSYIKKKG